MVCVSFSIDVAVLASADELGVDVETAARTGVATAVRTARLARGHVADETSPEVVDAGWERVEAWGE